MCEVNSNPATWSTSRSFRHFYKQKSDKEFFLVVISSGSHLCFSFGWDLFTNHHCRETKINPLIFTYFFKHEPAPGGRFVLSQRKVPEKFVNLTKKDPKSSWISEKVLYGLFSLVEVQNNFKIRKPFLRENHSDQFWQCLRRKHSATTQISTTHQTSNDNSITTYSNTQCMHKFSSKSYWKFGNS
jgi:hypothetical protein